MTTFLLTTTVDWPSVARMAAGFALAGRVDALAPAAAPVAMSRYIRKRHAYRALTPLASLRAAIAASQPDLVVPCDDRAVAQLLKLRAQALSDGNSHLQTLIARSLGRPDNFAALTNRSQSIRIVRQEGVRAPDMFPIASEAALETALTATGLPAVLKLDGSWGGDGVAVVQSRDEALAAYRRMSCAPSRLRSILRSVKRRDAHFLADAIAPPKPVVSLQRFVTGTPAASAFAAWNGEIAGEIYYDVIVADRGTGPPNVIRRVNCPEMAEASRKVARRFGLSGLFGIDFIRDAEGRAHLIEINPRGTQGGTLAFGKGADLPCALASRAAAGEVATRPAIASDIVVLFPREWQNDPASPWLSSGHHDVPWDDPGLLWDWFRAHPRPDVPVKEPAGSAPAPLPLAAIPVRS